MQVREARTEDIADIRDVASRSLEASYSHVLDEATIEKAIAEWYERGRLESEITSQGTLFVVAEEGGDVVGFSQSEVLPDVPEANVLWIHVDPDHRDGGVGTTLLGRTRERLQELDNDAISGFVLADNEEGNEFYRSHGFRKVDERTADIGDEEFAENVYTDTDQAILEPYDVDGRTLYVNRAESSRGSEAPFYVAFADEDGEDRYGYFCSNCESFDTAMDSMERIRCNDCGNQRKGARWDASYL
ncbi:GNAT family N-acetyltransferase [Halomicrococcus gelatinilyticus]|uniref:GNAT family N-acetyltransferase n=1 Tax=Halomicrococcus gelatinilyticus TaxID=1702103 RepID=UPI002E15EC97